MSSSHKNSRRSNIWRDKTITLMGLGVAGGGVEDAIFFIKNGVKKLIITDLKTKKQLEPSVAKIQKLIASSASRVPAVEWVLGKHREKDFIHTDLVIVNPGVPKESKYLKIAQKNNVKIDTSIGIFFELVNSKKLIGITGTKGKSTTTTLIYKILQTKYPSSYITGTLGSSPLNFINKKGWGVLELSSWRLEGMSSKGKSPHIAVILNVEQDHLNMHKSFKEYVNAKKIIFKYQDKNDYLLTNENLKKIIKQARSKIILLSAIKTTGVPASNAESLYPENINAALEIAKILKINKKTVLNIIKKFKGIDGRLQLVATMNGIKIYNDTTATNPFATLRSLNKLRNKKIALILGGQDKNLNYTKLSKTLARLHFVALMPGSASDKIYSWNMKHGTWNKNFQRIENLKSGLNKCIKSKPDIILFSPAAASFNTFANEFERGEAFNKNVKNLIKNRQ